MQLNKRRLVLIALSLVATFVVLRVYLHLSPATNLDVGQYNIHHLFTGLLLVTFSGLPLTLFHGNSRRLDLAALVFGAGLSMALDEWVYLITTDGSDASYLLPISLWGGVVMVGLAVAYLAMLAWFAYRCERTGQPSRAAQVLRD